MGTSPVIVISATHIYAKFTNEIGRFNQLKGGFNYSCCLGLCLGQINHQQPQLL